MKQIFMIGAGEGEKPGMTGYLHLVQYCLRTRYSYGFWFSLPYGILHGHLYFGIDNTFYSRPSNMIIIRLRLGFFSYIEIDIKLPVGYKKRKEVKK